MGRRFFITGLAAIWLAGGALAAEAEAIAMMDGPKGSGRSLGSAWSMACPAQQRLVGVTLYDDGRGIGGIEAVCAPLGRSSFGTVWAAAPAVAVMPDAAPVRLAVEDAPERPVILRASSAETGRQSGSRALLITVSRQPELRGWEPAGPERMTLKTGRNGRVVQCAEGAYVQGLRTGTEEGRRARLVALQLICTRGNGRSDLVGDWPASEKKTKKNKVVRAVVAARTQCGGGVANPHDGAAARALIGTAEDGRVVSLGVTCARSAVPGPVAGAADAAWRWMAALVPPQVRRGAKRVFKAPRWYAGSDVAVCRDGSGRGYCAQASADRFCTTMTGARSASFYVVGGFSADAIASGGKRCPSGACRAFQQIICAG